MSVLIKGMEMPKGCIVCPFKDIGMHTMTQCMLVAGWVKYADDGNGIPDACPLVEVPTPHGALIDRDALRNAVYRHLCIKGEENLLPAEKSVFGNIIKAPAIIEAEVEP